MLIQDLETKQVIKIVEWSGVPRLRLSREWGLREVWFSGVEKGERIQWNYMLVNKRLNITLRIWELRIPDYFRRLFSMRAIPIFDYLRSEEVGTSCIVFCLTR